MPYINPDSSPAETNLPSPSIISTSLLATYESFQGPNQSKMTLNNLQSLLEKAATADVSSNVIVYSDNLSVSASYTYQELFQVTQKASLALRKRENVRPGSVVLLHFNSHWENIVWFWAVLFSGCIPAISTAFPKNISHRPAHIKHLSTTLENPLCLTTKELFPEFAGQDAITPVPIESLDLEGAAPAGDGVIHKDSQLVDNAVLLFTSGSTGNSKAVALSHGQILAAIAGKYSVVPLPEDTSFLNWVGLDHVVGVVEIHLQALFARKDQIHVPGSQILSSPLDFISLLEKHRVSRTFAPNFFLAKVRDALLENEELPHPKKWDLTSLKYIASGGEVNVTKTCEQLSDLLIKFGTPKNVIVPGFGMTETCAGAIFNVDCPVYDKEQSLQFTSLGSPMPGIRMRVTDGFNNSVTPGETGNLEVKGPVVFKGYYNNPKATEEAFTIDGWFKTGDLSRLGQDGTLRLAGRAKETMIINGVNYSSHEIEDALEGLPGLTPTFTCTFSSFPEGGETEEICVVYLPTYSPDSIAERAQTADSISKTVLMSTGSRPRILPLDRLMLQKSALGKLSRGKIKTALEKGEYRSYEEANAKLMRQYRESTRSPPANDQEKRLLEIFLQSLDVSAEDFDVKTPIFDVGISSVELLKLKTDIEERLGMKRSAIPIITIMENTTVRDLSNALDKLAKPHEYSPEVVLQTHGDKKPLWLVHPGAGEILIFINLAKYLVDRPVYALRARGFNDGEKPFESIEEAADTYYNAVKARQPEGPYALAGYCYGAMLAVQVTKRLEANGDEVRFLGSFNLPPHIKARMSMLDWKECLLHLAYFLDLMTQPRSRELAAELTGKSQAYILDAVIENSNPERYAQLALSRPELVRWADVAYELHRMAGEYDPAEDLPALDVFFSVPLTIAAASMEEWRHFHLAKWDDFTRTPTRFHNVEGEHYSMIGPDHVLSFQKTLRKAMEARGI